MTPKQANDAADLLREAGLVSVAHQTGGNVWITTAICPINDGGDYRYLVIDENGLALYPDEPAYVRGDEPTQAVWFY